MSKMKILIIDDNYEKIQSIAELFKLNSSVEIDSENNSRSGLAKLKVNKYDIVLVDVIIPAVLGDNPSSDSGLQIIDMIVSNRIYHFPSYLLAITSHKQEYDKYKDILFAKGIELILYENNAALIKSFLSAKINQCQIHNLDSVPSTELVYPERVTLKWLFNNVGLEVWLWLVGTLFFVFSLGIFASKLDFVKNIIAVSSEAKHSQVVGK